MAEPTKEWQELDLFTKTQAALYEDVASEDLTDLRNRAAHWAIDRALTGDEHSKIVNALLVLSPDVNQVPQESPRIELRKSRSGLTLETFGLGSARFSIVSYYTGKLANQKVILERVTFDSGITPLIANSAKT